MMRGLLQVESQWVSSFCDNVKTFEANTFVHINKTDSACSMIDTFDKNYAAQFSSVIACDSVTKKFWFAW